MSFNNSAGTSTIQFFGATTTGLTAAVGMGIPMGNFVLVGDGRAPAGVNILRGGLCVDIDGWCTASTTGRISSVSSFIGGSDLAEMYHATEALEQGDVISVVSGINVSKARRGDKDKMMGVVSTAPGVVLGSGPDREGVAGDVPIALAGRVPLKVTTENGPIHAGDYLALSTVPGVGMRATKAGVAIGQALEDYSSAGVGKILVFVKNSYYSGLSLDSLPGLTSYSGSNSNAILQALMSGAHTSVEVPSDIAVDRLSAAIEVVTPKVTTDMLFATSIESPTITNLSNQLNARLSLVEADLAVENGALEARVSALENASTSPSFIAAVADKVKLALEAASEWTVNKITATLGTFNRVNVETAHVTKGIEMLDSATGATYCITIMNGEFDKRVGECGLTVVPPASSPATLPAEITSTSTDSTLGDIVSTTTEETITPPSEPTITPDETPTDAP
jgi:hypothetical protein